MKKLYQISLVVFLTLVSFFYTNQVINFIRETDPIMKNLKEYNKKNKIDAVNAKIENNKIKPGIVGKEVDYDKSFEKMKKYGTYNESLTVFKSVEPAISIDNIYDKYIEEGSGIHNDIGLVFVVKNGDDPREIVDILNNKGISATFFIDGLWLENNRDLVFEIASKNHEIEILNYDNKYEEIYFSSSLKELSAITNKSPKYCYASYDDEVVLNLCSKLKLHTIIPTFTTGNYPYKEVKQRIQKGSIISFNTSSSVKIELPTVINYIKQKGYNIDTLEYLLSEVEGEIYK